MDPNEMGMVDPTMAQEGAGAGAPSEEDQALYDWFVVSAMQLMDSPETQGDVIATLDGAGDPVEGAAETTVSIAMRILMEAESEGRPLPFAVVFEAVSEVFEHIVDTSEAAGLHDFSDEDMTAGFLRATDELRIAMSEAGLLDQDQVQGEFDDLVSAEQAGELEALLGDGVAPDERVADPLQDQPERMSR